MMYAAVARTDAQHEPEEADGFRERGEMQQGSGSDTVGLAVEDAPAPAGPPAPPPTVKGDFSSSVHWAVIAIEIKPLP